MASSSTQKVWVITGTSQGLGRELALAVLACGDKVIATARSSDKLKDLQEDYQENFSFLQLDVTETFESLSAKAKQAVAVWGAIDVLVNNAGYSIISTVEEGRVDGLIEMYRTNVFGTVNVTNAFLPYMRARRSGTVVFIGSRSGWRTSFPGNGLYGSSKAAIHAIADAMTEEVRPLNIRVLTVIPGGLRTANIDHLHYIPRTPEFTLKGIPDYAETRLKVKQYLDTTNGTQSGDPKKVAKAIADVVRGEGVAEGKAWNGTLFLGSDSYRDVRAKCEGTLRNLKDWEDVTMSIDV